MTCFKGMFWVQYFSVDSMYSEWSITLQNNCYYCEAPK